MQLVHLGQGGYALRKEESIIGRALLRNGRFLYFVLDAQWRGKGYGTWFYKQVLKAEHIRPDALLIAAHPEDGAACAFLKKRGFAPLGGVWRRRAAQPQVNALSVVHSFWRSHLRAGDFAVDATAGNGYDTALLCRLVGPSGRVLALDIQQQAVDATNARLARLGLAGVGQAVRASHAGLAALVPSESAGAVVFNLGYLPGGDHSLFTVPQTTLPALRAALAVIRPGGFITVCAYSGKAQGTQERDAVLAWADALDCNRYKVHKELFAHRAAYPPIALCIVRC